MYLTAEEEKALSGEYGYATQKAMELLVTLGDVNGAERLIPVTSVQVSGVSYKTIGDAGFEFLTEFSSSGARVKVLTTLNPAGAPLSGELPVPESFLRRQEEILAAYRSLGVVLSCTCTPYYACNLPCRGETIAWAESSSVAYANSVIGARTNRESSISALASAITGKTPLYGLHLDENRQPTHLVEVTTELRGELDYTCLGYHVSRMGGVPLFRAEASPGSEELKALGAALATGSVSLFHFHSVTPGTPAAQDLEKVQVGREELEEARDTLTTCDDPELIALGCPHASLREVLQVLEHEPEREVWVFTSAQVKQLVERHTEIPETVKLIPDTCMVVAPLEEMGVRSVGVTSAKAAYYSLHLSRLGVRLDTLEALLSGK